MEESISKMMHLQHQFICQSLCQHDSFIMIINQEVRQCKFLTVFIVYRVVDCYISLGFHVSINLDGQFLCYCFERGSHSVVQASLDPTM